MNIARASIQSFKVADYVVEQLIKRAFRDAGVNKMLKNYLSQYCSAQSLKYCHEIYNQNYRMVDNRSPLKLELQPSALSFDNFCSGIGIYKNENDESNMEERTKMMKESDKIIKKSRIRKQVQLNRQISKINKIQKIKQNNYQKLNIQQQQQDEQIIKYIKKQYQDINLKRNKSQQLNNGNQKIKNYQKVNLDLICFDYNCTTLKIINSNKNNLVNNIIHGSVENQQLSKQIVKNDGNQIDTKKEKKKQDNMNKNRNTQIKQPNIIVKIVESRIKQKKGLKDSKQLIKNNGIQKLNKKQWEGGKQNKNLDDYAPSKNNGKFIQMDEKKQTHSYKHHSSSQSKLTNKIPSNQVTIKQVSKQLNNSKKIKLSNCNGQQNSEQIMKEKDGRDLMEIKLPKININRNQILRIMEKKKEKEETFRSVKNKLQDKLRIRL